MAPSAFAQAVVKEQVFSAEMVGNPPGTWVDDPSLATLDPLLAATAFEQACVLTGASPAAAVDWALVNDFESVDAAPTSLDGYLGGQPGTVLVAPNTAGRVVLAVSQAQCSVWVERSAGPPLRFAVAALLDALAANGKGHKVQVMANRNMERAGAWRNQMEWRYRAPGSSSREWILGAATTLGDGPGTQILHMAPVPATDPTVVTPEPMPR